MHTPEAIEPIHREKAHRIRVDSKLGITYAIIAACDRDCAHVQISLLDQNETRLIQSPEKEPIVIISGTPATDGSYTAELHAPGCRMRACHAGMVVMRLDATPVRAPTVAEPPAPRSEHEPVNALQRELKRVGCDPGGSRRPNGDPTREMHSPSSPRMPMLPWMSMILMKRRLLLSSAASIKYARRRLHPVSMAVGQSLGLATAIADEGATMTIDAEPPVRRVNSRHAS